MIEGVGYSHIDAMRLCYRREVRVQGERRVYFLINHSMDMRLKFGYLLTGSPLQSLGIL